MQQENIKIFIIGNSREFLIRGVTDALTNEGYQIFFSDTSLDLVCPVPPDINICLVFSDGSEIPKHVIPLKEACSIRNMPVCVVGDKLGIEKIREIIPENCISVILKRPVGAREITEGIQGLLNNDNIGAAGGIPGIALIIKDKGFSEGFKRHFSDRFKVHEVDAVESAHVALSLKDVIMVVADCDLLTENDYGAYNSLCQLAVFQQLPLVVLTSNEDVVSLARAEIMRPAKVISKTMTIKKMIQILEDVVSSKDGSTVYHEPVTMGNGKTVSDTGAETPSNGQGGILGGLSGMFGTKLKWD